MSFGLIIDILGIGTILWAIGRLMQHFALKKVDDDPYHVSKSTRFVYYSSILFYLLGTLSSLIIESIDGMCHKRLYHNHLAEMRSLKGYVTLPNLQMKPFDEFCEEHDIGKYSSSAPLDIPFTWYSIHS